MNQQRYEFVLNRRTRVLHKGGLQFKGFVATSCGEYIRDGNAYPQMLVGAWRQCKKCRWEKAE